MNLSTRCLGAIAFLFLLASCKKDYLDKTDPTRINADLFYKDAKQVEQAVNGVYGNLQSIIGSQWIFNELPSDNTTVDFNPSDRGQADRAEAFEYFTVRAANPNIHAMYAAHYNAIYNANNTLHRMRSVTLSDSARGVYEGQLKFIRAYLYFQLTQYFGDVVLITAPLEQLSDAYAYGREGADKVYARIETDLREASAALPAAWPPGSTGRATRGAAFSLLGKVHLTRKNYGEAVAALRPVLSLGYSLVPDYAALFDPLKKNGPESIFSIQYQGGNDWGEWNTFIYVFAPRLSRGFVTGWPQSNPAGFNIPTRDLIQAYDSGDVRKAASIGLDFKSPVTGDTVPYIAKYDHPHAIYGRADDNWPVLRYADVLLMLAEAVNEASGPTPEAYGYLNAVRARAGLDSLSGLGREAFREKVLHERRVELAFENWRWFDLKRTLSPQDLAAFLNAYGARERGRPTVQRQGTPFSDIDYRFEEHEAWYPLPADELLVHGKLTQNRGY